VYVRQFRRNNVRAIGTAAVLLAALGLIEPQRVQIVNREQFNAFSLLLAIHARQPFFISGHFSVRATLNCPAQCFVVQFAIALRQRRLFGTVRH